MPEHICPSCKKPNYDDEALLCIYCGESLRRDLGLAGKIKYSRPRLIFFITAVLVLLAFALLMLK